LVDQKENSMETVAVIFAVLFVVVGWLWIHEHTANSKLKAVLRTALRAADNYKPGGRDEVRIRYNQLASLIGWESECFPQPDEKYAGKPSNRHPSMLSWARRRKLRK
jgi:hypothetical protein